MGSQATGGDPDFDPNLDTPGPGNPQICTCWHIQKRRILAAIAAGADTVAAIGEATRAGTGCGTCRMDLIEFLEDASGPGPDATP